METKVLYPQVPSPCLSVLHSKDQANTSDDTTSVKEVIENYNVPIDPASDSKAVGQNDQNIASSSSPSSPHSLEVFTVSVQNRFDALTPFDQEQQVHDFTQGWSHTLRKQQTLTSSQQRISKKKLCWWKDPPPPSKQILSEINITSRTSSLIVGDSAIRCKKCKKIPNVQWPIIQNVCAWIAYCWNDSMDAWIRETWAC